MLSWYVSSFCLQNVQPQSEAFQNLCKLFLRAAHLQKTIIKFELGIAFIKNEFSVLLEVRVNCFDRVKLILKAFTLVKKKYTLSHF